MPGDWAARTSDVPGATTGGPPPITTRQRIAPSIGLCIVAALLTLLGREIAALVAVAGAIGVGVASFASDGFVRAFHRLQHRIAHGVGVGLTFVLLVPVHYLILTPAGFIARLFRVDTLRPTSGGDGWQERSPEHRSRPRKGYADERSTLAPESRNDRRWRTVRVVAVVLLVEALAVGIFVVIDRRTTPQQEFQGVSGPGPRDSAALRDLPYVDEMQTQLGQVASGGVYTPTQDQSLRDFQSRYVNVTNRVRRSYETTLPGEPLDVWFFGGSTMFGFDGQRDDHTIPSEVVRLGEAEGRPIRARNYGAQGLTNYQETQIFAQLLVSGERPDLVVFYDGINDIALQLQNALAHRDVAGEPGQLQSNLIREAMTATGITPSDAAPSPLLPANAPVPAGEVSLDDLVQDIVGVYGDGIELSINLGNAYGVPVLHFWQPDLLTRTPLDPGEEELLAVQGMDEMIYGSLRAFWARVRAALPEGVIDISTAFDQLDVPVLSDIVHVNEDGARAVAAAMYPSIAAAAPATPAP
ncbi:MAG: SGNH/GDSL hydrolase family protein [Acidimicrobiales bacterium]|nr:SGNH/GDSL hydrolase family protein [Acidimicrobiales bacterium]